MVINGKGWLSLAAVLLLVGCECEKAKTKTSIAEEPAPVVQEDSSLQSDVADFLRNAGDRVFFGFDKSSLSEDMKATLTRQAEWLKAHPNRRVLIEGHCDERGTREYNLGLGERRADAAAKFLIEKGVDGSRIRTISYGKDRPIEAQGSQEEIYKLNRVAIAVLE